MLLRENRKPLDGRRVLAFLIDAAVLAPLAVLSWRYEWGIRAMALGLELVYFFLCEATGGQTIGKAVCRLRVVTVDGDIAGPRAIAARTILRQVEGLLGLLVMVCTGGRRQRLGDIAAKTVVVDSREVEPAPVALSGALLGYPVAWLVPATIVFALTATGTFPGSYRYEVDELCKSADAAVRDRPAAFVAVLTRETAALQAVKAPPHWKARHANLVAEYATLGREARRLARRVRRSDTPQATFAQGFQRLVARGRASNDRLAALGYKGCAGLESA